MMALLSVIDGGAPKPPASGPGARAYQLTDIGNAERFVARHGVDVHYLPAWSRWLVWDGRRWATDQTLDIYRRAKDTVRAMLAEASTLAGMERELLAKHAIRSEADGKLKAMLERVKAEPGVAIIPAALDADPWALAVDNGVIDLRTGELHPHTRERLISKISPVVHDPEAECPRWLAFLERVMGDNTELIDFLQRAVGYSLTGCTDAQCLFFLHGSGQNGKSTFLELLRTITGEYSSQADFTTFLDKKSDGPRNDIARLVGARVVTSSEVGEGKRLNESLVKSLTGQDTVTARFLYSEAFEYIPSFKLWLSANHKPVIRGTDNAIWRRIRLVPFTVQIPDEEKNENLLAELKTELPGILAWALRGCLAWLERGLDAPTAVTSATEQYRLESDTLGSFLEDWCELDATAAERSTDLYQAYREWAKESGEFELSQTMFGRKLEERGFSVDKRGRGNERTKWRTGIRLIRRAASSPPSPSGASLNGDHKAAAAGERTDEQEGLLI